MAAVTILKIQNIVKRFGRFTALHGIDLDVQAGEFLTIVGPSGSGKTTLIRLLAGMDEPSSGNILLHDRHIENTPANQRPTCMVFQSLALFPHRSVGQNIEFPLKIRKVDSRERRAKALALLDLLRLPDNYYDKRIHECSGGERQRVALARALAYDPEILFFDEPLSALDYRLRKALEKELKSLHQRTGKTFVYITHSLEEAMVMSDRIAIMRAGRFEQIATADEIYSRPLSRFVAEFMGEVNLFEVHDDPGGRFASPGIDIRVDDFSRWRVDQTETAQAVMMIRPEFIRFLSAGEHADFSITGRLTGEYSLGSRIQYEIETRSDKLLVVERLLEHRYSGEVGDAVTVGWDLGRTHLIRENG